MIKHKQPQKVWVDDGTEFLGAFKKHSATNEEFICIVLSVKRSLRLQKETSGH